MWLWRQRCSVWRHIPTPRGITREIGEKGKFPVTAPPTDHVLFSTCFRGIYKELQHTGYSQTLCHSLLAYTVITMSRLSTVSVMCFLIIMAISCQCKEVVPFKKNLDQVFKEWSCKSPQPRLVYLGTVH